MQIMKKTFTLSSLLLACGLSFSTLHAEELKITAERCELGTTCSIPGNDNGITYYDVSPANGNSFQCRIKADSGQYLSVWVNGSKEYTINKGWGLYHAEPEVVVNIFGRFENPDNPQTVGQIRFTKLMGGQGKVTCEKLNQG